MNSQSPTVSVIIPCYNQGIYLDEAVESVLAQTYQNFEIIIINDGSTEQETIGILKNYQKAKTTVIHTENQGVSTARNTGINAANGKYILPLDADDKIEKTYLQKAVELLENNANLGIVYCEVEFFGDCQEKWNLEQYKFPDILLQNVIFCSGFFKKTDWLIVKGYNPNMIDGWEDYDFWLSIIELGREVHRIPETLFFYRQKQVSRTKLMNFQKSVDAHVQIFKNHQSFYLENLDFIFKEIINFRVSIAHLENNIVNQNNNIANLKNHISNLENHIHNQKNHIFNLENYIVDLENKTTNLEAQVTDFIQQRNRGIERINQLENNEKELEKNLKKTQTDFRQVRAELDDAMMIINSMESSKFWKLRNTWLKIKRLLRITEKVKITFKR